MAGEVYSKLITSNATPNKNIAMNTWIQGGPANTSATPLKLLAVWVSSRPLGTRATLVVLTYHELLAPTSEVLGSIIYIQLVRLVVKWTLRQLPTALCWWLISVSGTALH
nr:hypothetical protein [Secundilactobacillus kimchicus]